MSVPLINSRITLAARDTAGSIGIVENLVLPGWPGPHTLANLADSPARYLLVCTPGGFEQRFGPDADNTPSGPTTDVVVVGPRIPEMDAER